MSGYYSSITRGELLLLLVPAMVGIVLFFNYGFLKGKYANGLVGLAAALAIGVLASQIFRMFVDSRTIDQGNGAQEEAVRVTVGQSSSILPELTAKQLESLTDTRQKVVLESFRARGINNKPVLNMTVVNAPNGRVYRTDMFVNKQLSAIVFEGVWKGRATQVLCDFEKGQVAESVISKCGEMVARYFGISPLKVSNP